MAKEIHPSVKSVLTYFEYVHLPPFLQEVSKKFYDLAWRLALDEGLDGSQIMWGMMDLLRAKDCFVRAALANPAEE